MAVSNADAHIDVVSLADEQIDVGGSSVHVADNHEDVEDDSQYETITGEVVQTEDGTFYVATDDAAADVDIEGVSRIQVVMNEDGTETVIFENESTNMDLTGTEAHIIEEKPKLLQRGPHGEQYEVVHDGMHIGDEEYMNDYSEMEIKGRRNRVYGQAKCPECGQTFINTARLERHLSVHQVFGAFLCQLCGKTYKYEYNLFYHWRKTCRDLNQLISEEERKSMEVNSLREIVEDIASKKSDLGSLELGISTQPLFRTLGVEPSEMTKQSKYGKRGVMCKACGVTVLAAHLPKHLNVHSGRAPPDQQSIGGGFVCDLCGEIYRHRENLYKHWRSRCPYVIPNLMDEELVLDDDSLRAMVEGLLKKQSIDVGDELTQDLKKQSEIQRTMFGTDAEKARALDSLTADLNVDLSGLPADEDNVADSEQLDENMFDQKWIEEHGIVFADEIGEDGSRIGTTSKMYAANTQNDMVQCPECFKTFMSISRLEKHMAGYHGSSGTHHCVLCGNRFKYDYNLLYHYRRSCAYTKVYIDRDVREQIDSTSLRKLVRSLSQRQPSLPTYYPTKPNTSMQGDAAIHKQMLHGMHDESDNNAPPVTRIAPHNVQPPRQGLPHGYRCPHCAITFYGLTAIRLHMKMRHDEGFEAKDDDDVVNEEIVTEMPDHILNGGVDPNDPPPALDVEGETYESKPIVRHQILDEDGNDITNTPDVQRLIASGEIQFREGEQIILVNQAVDDAYVYEEPIEHQEIVETEERPRRSTRARNRPSTSSTTASPPTKRRR